MSMDRINVYIVNQDTTKWQIIQLKTHVKVVSATVNIAHSLLFVMYVILDIIWLMLIVLVQKQ